MESFEQVLKQGGHSNTLGRSDEVLVSVKNSPKRLNELFSCIYADDAWVRMRAMDVFEKLIRERPGLANAYTDRLLGDLLTTSQPSIQWHLAQLFASIDLDQIQAAKAIVWLKKMISSPSIDWIVSVNVMKTLVYFYDNKEVKLSDLIPLFEIQTGHSSKTVRKKAKQFIEEIT